MNEDIKIINEKNIELEKENPKLKDDLEASIEENGLLKSNISELHGELVRAWLKCTSNELQMSTKERITIYYYYDPSFYLLARFSLNSEYSEIHRETFKRTKGVISEAWKYQECIKIKGCPSFKDDPEGYYAYSKEHYNYSETACKNLTMKSCQYIAISIKEMDECIGVIVFESDHPEVFNSEKVEKITAHCEKSISYLIGFTKKGIELGQEAKIVKLEAPNEVEKKFIDQLSDKEK